MPRMRIDLDGVPLKDPKGRVLCVFRFRTTEGVIVNLPESVDVTIPWSAIENATLDLASGRLRITFGRGPERPRWAEDVDTVDGEWTDRELLAAAPVRSRSG